MTSLLGHHLTWLLPAICLVYIASNVFRATRPSEGMDIRDFGTLPVVSSGRVQPLDSLVRNTLLAIYGKQSVPGEGAPATPAAWLAELAFKPALADTRKIFLIHHDDLLGLTGFTRGDVIALVAFFTASAVHREDWKARMQTSQSVEDIITFYSKFKEFGQPRQQHLNFDGQEHFAHWIEREDGQVQFFWLYQRVSKHWNLLVDHPQVASHFGAKIVWHLADGQFQMISSTGKVLARYPKKTEATDRAAKEDH